MHVRAFDSNTLFLLPPAGNGPAASQQEPAQIETGTSQPDPLAEPAPGLEPWPDWLQALYNFGPIILIVLVFYVFIISGNRKKEKDRATLISSLTRGDRVTTIGGIIGSVVDASGDEVVLKIDENNNTKMRVTRAAVASVVKADGGERKG